MPPRTGPYKEFLLAAGEYLPFYFIFYLPCGFGAPGAAGHTFEEREQYHRRLPHVYGSL